MTLTYIQETMSDAIPEMQALAYEHWHYVTDHEWPVDPDWDKFRELERIGLVRFLAARDGTKLVGYMIFLLCPALHYKTKLQAHDDAFFLKAEYRKGWAGYKMFRAAQAMLAKDNVDRIVIHMKVKVPIRSLLKRLGYRQREENWFLDM